MVLEIWMGERADTYHIRGEADLLGRLDAAAARLSAGELVAFPTETVYGLGADATNAEALGKVFRLKGRPADHPLIVHLASAVQLSDWATDIPASGRDLAERFWPGPLTLVLKRQPGVLDAVTGGQETVALRVPAHPLAQALLRRFGGGIAAPSANRFGHISPTTAAHVRSEFGEAVMVLDGGPCGVGLESTILDLSSGTPRVLRPGGVTLEALGAVLKRPILSGSTTTSPRVSGSLTRHYAPQTPTFLLPDAAPVRQNGDAVLTHRRTLNPSAKDVLPLPDDPVAYARGLYGALRELDARGYGRLLIETVPDRPEWNAVRDRLSRAAVPFTPSASRDKEEIHG